MIMGFARLRNLLGDKLLADKAGAVVIETAIVAPVLIMMSLGAYDVSRIVARQTELQSAVAEVTEIAIAIKVDTQNERDKIKTILVSATGAPANSVTVANSYRCGAAAATVTDPTTCAVGDQITTYLDVSITDVKSPLWTNFGVGQPITLRVDRKVVV